MAAPSFRDATRPAPALVILAAGMGSRFGGMKQLAAVGPSGETLMDYSVFDAARAGFGSVVFVIRPEMERSFREFASARYASTVPFTTAHQRLDDVPAGARVHAGRLKPWGTGQAVLAAEPAVGGPFAVVNADDFYGAGAYAAVSSFFSESARDAGAREAAAAFALVGYRMQDTLSEAGGVNRGVLRVGSDGALASIEEVFDIRSGSWPGETLVSMNMWGFTPAVFRILREGFKHFLARDYASNSEYLLPAAIQTAVDGGAATVRVLDPESAWFGITYPADAHSVSTALRGRVADGWYPSPLFA